MAFVPFASWNSRSITHLANCLSQSLPMNSSDDSHFYPAAFALTQLRHEACNFPRALFKMRIARTA